MPEEYLICSTNHSVCKEKRGRKLGEKVQRSLIKLTEMQKDDLITAALSTVTSAGVSDAHVINAILTQEMLTKP